MKKLFYLAAIAALCVLPGCRKNTCRKPCELDSEETQMCQIDTTDEAIQVAHRTTPRTSGPLTDREINWSKEDYGNYEPTGIEA